MTLRERKLVVAIKHRILDESWTGEWSDVATLTGGNDIIYGHDRLLRSLRFGDNDYEDCVAEVIASLIEQDCANLESLVEYFKVDSWLKHHDPHEYASLFGHTQLLLDNLKNDAIRTSFALNQYILRIQDAIESDAELAIGSTKDLLESVLKSILVDSGETLSGREDIPTLLKQTQKVLKLHPSEVDENAKGRDIVKRTLSNLGQIVDNLNQLRNIYGSGKGRAENTGVTSRHARLAVNAGAALAVFLIETYEYHEGARC